MNMLTPKFQPGKLAATPGALEAMDEAGQSAEYFLNRHVVGDWGELSPDDWQLNDEALKDGSRLLSAYRTLKAKKLWVITEADRSATTILLPDEY